MDTIPALNALKLYCRSPCLSCAVKPISLEVIDCFVTELGQLLKDRSFNVEQFLLLNVARGLDTNGDGRLAVEDFKFLEKWKLPEFLTAKPSEEAKEDVKRHLLHVSRQVFEEPETFWNIGPSRAGYLAEVAEVHTPRRCSRFGLASQMVKIRASINFTRSPGLISHQAQ